MPRVQVPNVAMDIRDVIENRKRFVVICDRVEHVEPLLPDGCANLMPIDGPYHGVKSHGWDNEHRSDKACGNQMSGHYFSRIQWALPTRKNYDKLREAFNATGGDFLARPYEELRIQYEELRIQYEELRIQYEELRRPFNVTPEDQYTDVWIYPTVPYRKDKHPCEKPEAMARDIVRISSRPNDVVLVFFSGSGIFASEALKQGRRVIAVEMDPHWAKVTEHRCIEALP